MIAMRTLLRRADRLGAGLITWRHDPEHGWFCFASSAQVPHVARGTTGLAALAELVTFLQKIRT